MSATKIALRERPPAMVMEPILLYVLIGSLTIIVILVSFRIVGLWLQQKEMQARLRNQQAQEMYDATPLESRLPMPMRSVRAPAPARRDDPLLAAFDQEWAEHLAIGGSVGPMIAQAAVGTKAHKISRARELTESGDPVAAVNAWKELLLEDSHSPQIWAGLADALARSGEVVAARQCQQRAGAIGNPPPPKKKATPVSKPSLSRPVSNYLSEDDERGMSTGSGHPARYQSPWDDEDDDEEEDG